MKMIFSLITLATMPAFSQQPNVPNLRPTQSGLTRPQILSATGLANTVITHVADGGSWKTAITLINLSQDKMAPFQLNFYGDSGAAQSFSFEGIGNASTVTGTIPAGGSTVVKTTGTNAVTTQGWAQFIESSTTNSIGGWAVFTNSNGNEAAVPVESSTGENPILFFDNTKGYGMGVALTNSNYLPLTITATFKDENGSILGVREFTMATFTHTSFIFADQWPFTAGHQGTVDFQCTAFGLAVLGLRFTPQGAFTSVTAFERWTLN